MTTLTVYHYSSVKFNRFDLSKCDGFWFTDIAPESPELLNEIGAAGSAFCAKCEITFDDEIINGDNYDVEDFLRSNDADCIVNNYDGFTDYALIDSSKIEIIEWIKMTEIVL